MQWCAEDEAAPENVEQADETRAEAPPPEDAAPVADAAPAEDAVPGDSAPSADAGPVEDAAPVQDAAPVEDAVPVEDAAPAETASAGEATVSAEHAPPPPEPVDEPTEQIEPTEEAAPPPDAASAEQVPEMQPESIDKISSFVDASSVDGDITGLKAAPRIESGCRLNRDVLLASLEEVQTYLQQTDVEQQTDESYLGRLGEMVAVLNADMNNLRAYCERAQTQLESIRSPIKDITDKIFKTIPVAEEEEEQRKYTDFYFPIN